MESAAQNNLFDLQVDHLGVSYLRDAAYWARFLAIAGFIFCGLFIVVAVLVVSLLSSLFNSVGASGTAGIGAIPIAFVYVGIAVLNFFPCLYLYNFAAKMHAALRGNDQDQLNTAFRNMRAFYRFVGVMMIIALGIFLLGILSMVFITAGAGKTA